MERGSLSTYARKRDFQKTAEPRGAVLDDSTATERQFVIHKHAASHLHYDLRLQIGGVLKSWAVPKGPSLDPSHKRLAMEVEDHPIAYGPFEGTIPQGEYGGGTVMLWDEGAFQPEGDAMAALQKGHLVFALTGHKLHGRFQLLRLRGKDDGKQKPWLLMKLKDGLEQAGGDVDHLDTTSVKTGRSMDEIAAGGPAPGASADPARDGAVWESTGSPAQHSKAAPKATASKATVSKAEAAPKAKAAKAKSVDDDVHDAVPGFIEPQLCTAVTEPPTDAALVHEMKIDGYRVLARKDGDDVTLFTRSGLDWSARFPVVVAAVAALPIHDVMLDGEVAALDAEGTPSFQALQRSLEDTTSTPRSQRYKARANEAHGPVVFYGFDCLFLEGHDLREHPLIERKAALEELLKHDDTATLRYLPHVSGDPVAFLAQMERAGQEGMVSKPAASPYRSGRSGAWLKLRLRLHQEVVVVGYTDLEAERGGVGALLVAAKDESGALRFAGKVGSGFSDALRRSLAKKLEALHVSEAPVSPAPRERGAHWVKPQIVVEVAYSEITSDGKLRQASLLGVRGDKASDDVVLEGPVDASAAKRAARGAALPNAAPEPVAKRAAAAVAAPVAAAVARSPSTQGDVVAGVRITHPERAVFTADAEAPVVTKLDVARYVEAVAPLMLPFVARRPLSVARCPDGSSGGHFFQKHLGRGMPSSVESMSIAHDEHDAITVSTAAGLVGLVQMGVLEVHPWGAHPDEPERPDRMIFDLDPAPGIAWSRIADGARTIRERLAGAGLESFVMSTGGKGLHVTVPLSGVVTWEDVKTFARAFAEAMERDEPTLYTANIRKQARADRIFIDHLRNGRGSTAISPWSMRARAGGPVAVPLSWEEIDDVTGDAFTVLNLHERFTRGGAATWARFFEVGQTLAGGKPVSTRPVPTRTAAAKRAAPKKAAPKQPAPKKAAPKKAAAKKAAPKKAVAKKAALKEAAPKKRAAR